MSCPECEHCKLRKGSWTVCTSRVIGDQRLDSGYSHLVVCKLPDRESAIQKFAECVKSDPSKFWVLKRESKIVAYVGGSSCLPADVGMEFARIGAPTLGTP